MSPTPYTTILLCPLCTVSTASTVYRVHCVTASTESTGLTFFASKKMFTASTAYCVHCVLWFDLFVSKTMSPPPYITILLHPLHTASTASTVYCVHFVTASTETTGLMLLHQRQCLHHHIPLFYCIHCELCPLRPLCTVSTV